jgi:ribonuclease T1
MPKRLRPVIVAGVVLLLFVAVNRLDTDNTANTQRANTESASEVGPQTTVLLDTASDLPKIGQSELPPEAIETIADILAGGPYDFSNDDSVFQNREGILPAREHNHYREYTVITPGERDRGARRVVSGADGDFYYTSDHYSSFSEILS